jgi:hypothetical protein
VLFVVPFVYSLLLLVRQQFAIDPLCVAHHSREGVALPLPFRFSSAISLSRNFR